MAEPYKDADEEIDAVSVDSRRLAAALKVARLYLDDDTLHCIVGPPHCQLALGHVVDGALALHEQIEARRNPS